MHGKTKRRSRANADSLLRTANDIIDALRSRKDALQLSDAMLDELAGLSAGHAGKCLGPSRERTPSLYTLLSIAGALGMALQLVEDPQSKVRQRYTSRRNAAVHVADRISKVAVRKARPVVLAAAASKAAKARWARSTPEQRQSHIAMMNLARKNKAA